MKRFFTFLLLFGAAWLGGKDYSDHVKRVNDKVFVDSIPQISQKRSFCAPASAAMVLGYFDAKMTQNKLAHLFGTSKKRGTSTEELIEEFEHGRLKNFSIRKLYGITEEEFALLLDAYVQQSEISASKIKKLQKRRYEAFGAVDPSVAVPIFARSRTQLRQFMVQTLKEYIDCGIPLLWSVEMNLDPYERLSDGHMRLLVGYATDKKGEIRGALYRDPWGRHARIKQMPIDNAVAMTYEILVILPAKER